MDIERARVMGLALFRVAPILLAPIFVSGCMTELTLHKISNPEPIYQCDRVSRVEKVLVTQDTNLIMLCEGNIAGGNGGPFTITIALPDTNELATARKLGMDAIRVDRSAVAEGWPAPQDAGAMPVAVVSPLVLHGYSDAAKYPGDFPGLSGVERTLYFVWTDDHADNLQLVYVARGTQPHRVFFRLDRKYLRQSDNALLALLLPLCVAGDIATLPIQGIIILLMPGS